MKFKSFTFLLSFLLGFFVLYPAIRYYRAPVVHVFFETYASNPAFCEMIEFAKLPAQTPKIIAWHRYPDRKKKIDLTPFNTTEIDLPQQEGLWSLSTSRVVDTVLDLYAKNKDTRFVFYANLTQQRVALIPFLRVLPRKNIEHIHLFEDGFGEFFKRPDRYHNNGQLYDKNLTDRLSLAIKNRGLWDPLFDVSLHKIYPVTYHVMHADRLKNILMLIPLINWWQDADVKNVDFHTLSKIMTPDQKRIVYRLSGFDYDRFYPFMHHQKTIVFTFGYHFGNKTLEESELNLLKALKTKTTLSHNGKTYRWFYKSHPTLSLASKTAQMTKLFPDMIEIPAQVPYEVLILANLKPYKTAGFGSSLFYSLSANDVLVYARRAGDTYLPFLLKFGFIKPHQIVNLNDFKNQH